MGREPETGATRRPERGANLVEYILLVTLIALAVIAAVVFLRGQIGDKFGETGSKIRDNGAPTVTPTGGDQIVVCGAWVERDALTGVVVGLPPCQHRVD